MPAVRLPTAKRNLMDCIKCDVSQLNRLISALLFASPDGERTAIVTVNYNPAFPQKPVNGYFAVFPAASSLSERHARHAMRVMRLNERSSSTAWVLKVKAITTSEAATPFLANLSTSLDWGLLGRKGDTRIRC